MCLRLFFVQMDVQVMTWLQKEATTPPPSGNLYPNSENLPKRVENPNTADWKSLPKMRKNAGVLTKQKKRTGKSALMVGKEAESCLIFGGKRVI